MDYSKAVAEGRRLVKQEGEIRFALGDLALQAAPNGGDLLRRLAEDIGLEFDTLRQYRDVAKAWPAALRKAGATWSVHQTLMGMPNRAEAIRPGMKVAEARQLAGRRPARGLEETRAGLAQLPPDRKAEVVAEALQDPEVAERVVPKAVAAQPKLARELVEDPKASVELVKARQQQAADREERAETRSRASAPVLHDQQALYAGLVDLDNAERRVLEALGNFQRMTQVSDRSRGQITERATAVTEALKGLSAWLRAGPGFDQELAALLEGEGGESA